SSDVCSSDLVILDGCRILFLGKVHVTAVVEGIGEFRILPQGFVKVLNGVIILSGLVVAQAPCLVDVSEPRFAAQSFVIILYRGLVLLRFIVSIAALIIGIRKVGI